MTAFEVWTSPAGQIGNDAFPPLRAIQIEDSGGQIRVNQPRRDDVRARSGQRSRQTLKRAAAQGYSVLTAMPRVPLSGMAGPGGLCLPRCPTASLIRRCVAAPL
jgi:hypothetical protein